MSGWSPCWQNHFHINGFVAQYFLWDWVCSFLQKPWSGLQADQFAGLLRALCQLSPSLFLTLCLNTKTHTTTSQTYEGYAIWPAWVYWNGLRLMPHWERMGLLISAISSGKYEPSNHFMCDWTKVFLHKSQLLSNRLDLVTHRLITFIWTVHHNRSGMLGSIGLFLFSKRIWKIVQLGKNCCL